LQPHEIPEMNKFFPEAFKDEDVEESFVENPSPEEEEDAGFSAVQYASCLTPSTPVSQSGSLLCTSDPASPITPNNADPSFHGHLASRPRSLFTSLISGLHCFFRLPISNSHQTDKSPDPELFTIDI
jgi:hypothetical protein